MGYTESVLATAAGAAVFAAVTATVSTALAAAIEFSLLVAIPAGIGFGMATMTVVYVGFADRVGSRGYRLSFALGAYGVTFLATFAVGVATGYPVSRALLIGAGAGLVAAVGVGAGSAR